MGEVALRICHIFQPMDALAMVGAKGAESTSHS